MLKEDWFAAAEDEIHPRMYLAGSVLTGELLERARSLGKLVDEKPARKAHAKAPENK